MKASRHILEIVGADAVRLDIQRSQKWDSSLNILVGHRSHIANGNVVNDVF